MRCAHMHVTHACWCTYSTTDISTHGHICIVFPPEYLPLLLRWFDTLVCLMKDTRYHFSSTTREAQTGPYLVYFQITFVCADYGTQLASVVQFGIVFVSLLNELHASHTSCLPANFRQRGFETVWGWMKMCFLLSSNYVLFTLLLRTIHVSLSIRLGAELFMR